MSLLETLCPTELLFMEFLQPGITARRKHVTIYHAGRREYITVSSLQTWQLHGIVNMAQPWMYNKNWIQRGRRGLIHSYESCSFVHDDKMAQLLRERVTTRSVHLPDLYCACAWWSATTYGNSMTLDTVAFGKAEKEPREMSYCYYNNVTSLLFNNSFYLGSFMWV